ncbi:MAG: hypothetical protein NPIRA06_17570 [Nitrospirales bacterium]|nr:MAG: hypothetical protein NPIRA06_17570 [Nitrospirales bacterium]
MQGFKDFMMVVGLVAFVMGGRRASQELTLGVSTIHMGSSLMREWGMVMAIMRVWVGMAVFQSWPWRSCWVFPMNR